MGNADMGAVNLALIIGQREAVMDTFFAEARICGASGEKVSEGVASLHNRHLRRVLGDLRHPGKLRMLEAVQLAAQRHL